MPIFRSEPRTRLSLPFPIDSILLGDVLTSAQRMPIKPRQKTFEVSLGTQETPTPLMSPALMPADLTASQAMVLNPSLYREAYYTVKPR